MISVLLATALCLNAATAQVALSPEIATSYPWNPLASRYDWDELKKLRHVYLAKLISRTVTSNKILFKPDSYSSPTVFLDRFELLSDDGKPTDKKESLDVVTAEYRPPGQTRMSVEPSLKPGHIYLVGIEEPLGFHVVVNAHGSHEEGSRLKIELERGQVVGLLCLCSDEVRRSSNTEGNEDPMATLLLSIGLSLARAQTELEASERIDILEHLKFPYYVDDRIPDPETLKPHKLVLAGVPSPDWMKRVFVPTLMPVLNAAKNTDISIYGFGLVSRISPEGAEASKRYFELKYAAAKAGKGFRYNPIGYMYAVGKERLFKAAAELPSHSQFFPYTEMDKPPPDAEIRTIISWLDKVNNSFAISLLKCLAAWADKKAAGITFSLKPKLLPEYKNGEQLVENKEFLIRLWQENPPPIRRGGS